MTEIKSIVHARLLAEVPNTTCDEVGKKVDQGPGTP